MGNLVTLVPVDSPGQGLAVVLLRWCSRALLLRLGVALAGRFCSRFDPKTRSAFALLSPL